jgi:hypothetical protein
MANMQQIQLKFDAIEDSLLLRVSSTDDVEFRFWMTRRFVNLIWPALQKALSETPRIQTQSSPEAKKELLAFEHEKAVSDSDFKTPFKETPKNLPLGDQPILLAKMQMPRTDAGATVMALAPEQGPGIDLALNAGLSHSLTELISNAASIAAWDLSTTIDESTISAVPENVKVN